MSTPFFKVRRSKVNYVITRERKTGFPTGYQYIRDNKGVISFLLLEDTDKDTIFFVDKETKQLHCQFVLHRSDDLDIKQEYLYIFQSVEARNKFLADHLTDMPASIDLEAISSYELNYVTVIEYI